MEEGDKVTEFAADLAKERLKKYEDEINGIESFRANLEKLAHEIVTKENGVSPLIFFIDELDRCRPDFAIVLLERIKHLFNVNRIVFVLSIDRSQLNESVRATYGLHTNPDGYLRRFIELAYALPQPTNENFVASLYNRFAMDECFKQINYGSRHAEIWKTAFGYCSKALSLSLRSQEQCFTEMYIVWRIKSPQHEINPAALAFYAALRAHDPAVFQELRQQRGQFEKTIDLFAGINDFWYQVWFEAALISIALGKREDRLTRLLIMKEKFIKPGDENRYDRNDLVSLVHTLKEDHLRSKFLETLSFLEMSDQFR